ncbi:MAG: 6-chlorohydroxyquinol-1,2-dioxygenase [SAR86 cluster bacterium]|uniref:6-chlorohydroxyquinol-1,2-dioxygenase n=1 Tax=SAR86 cluster bacterium TaxID=2030880 RepID=A0A2A5C5W3_9GAMM|nr:MAG: 6-chlorohydroxyquinol-1,2-dioxygenase [SAR86 cluster bacterium]
MTVKVKDFGLNNLPDAVLEEYGDKTKDPRFRKVMLSLITHLHAFAKDVELTEEEWFAGIQFLTAVGQKCDDVRQEFILLSDTLGLSSLVDSINHDSAGGSATESTVLGPFYAEGAPELPMGANIVQQATEKGIRAVVMGDISNEQGQPIVGATLDVWQSSSDGFYHMQDENMPDHNLTGRFVTGEDGKYYFATEKPAAYPVPTDGPVGDMLRACGRHPMRPGHLHFIITAPGYKRLCTHIFTNEDEYLDSDAVFATKTSLVGEYKDCNDEALAKEMNVEMPFEKVVYNFILAESK